MPRSVPAFKQVSGEAVPKRVRPQTASSPSRIGAVLSAPAFYQHPFTKTWILRLDAMKGWRQGQKDIYGARVELRRKF